MSNILLGYPNYADAAALSGGDWSPTLPLTNVRTRLFGQVARTTSADLLDTQFAVDLGAQKSIALVALTDHNLTAGAVLRVTGAADGDFLDIQYQSAWVRAWPWLGLWALEWRQPEFWSGGLSKAALAQYRPVSLVVPETKIWARYWRVEISDTSNPDGYVQIGRLYLCDGYRPETNISYGRGLGYESRTIQAQATSGAKFFERRQPVRVLQAELDWMSEGEAYERVMQMQRALDTSEEVFYVEKPSEPSSYLQRAFPACFRKLSPIAWPHFASHRTPIELEELIG